MKLLLLIVVAFVLVGVYFSWRYPKLPPVDDENSVAVESIPEADVFAVEEEKADDSPSTSVRLRTLATQSRLTPPSYKKVHVHCDKQGRCMILPCPLQEGCAAVVLPGQLKEPWYPFEQLTRAMHLKRQGQAVAFCEAYSAVCTPHSKRGLRILCAYAQKPETGQHSLWEVSAKQPLFVNVPEGIRQVVVVSCQSTRE